MRFLLLLLIAVFGLATSRDCAAALFPPLFHFGGKKKAEEKPAEKIDDTKRSLQERVMKPDITKTFDPVKGSPSAIRSVKGKDASTKEFSTKAFSARDFSARKFAGSKEAYVGKSKVATPSAQTKGRNEVPNLTTKAPTKEMPVTAARDAGKSVDTRKAYMSNQQFLVKGRSQDLFDKEKGAPETSKPPGYGGDLRTLTLEDIRELLNKNK